MEEKVSGCFFLNTVYKYIRLCYHCWYAIVTQFSTLLSADI